jgi:chloramphenicol O-acetyltransferase
MGEWSARSPSGIVVAVKEADVSREPRRIDMESWPRRAHFEMFRGLDYPYFNLSADVDVAPLVRAHAACSATSSFTVHLVYALGRAANEVPEFRQRIRGGDVVEHAVVHPSITVLMEDETFGFCFFEYAEDPHTFVRAATEAMKRARAAPSIEDEPERDDFLFMTAIPWVSFTSLMHPVPLDPPDSVPRIAWGRYRNEGERMPMPLSVHAHHGLIDGLHVGRFYEGVQRLIDDAARWVDGPE